MMFFRRSPKKTVKEDEELLRLYKASGDIVFISELYEKYVHLIFGVCLKYLKNEEESKDMAMQVFEKLCQVAKTSLIVNFKSWIHVLTKNECLMLMRSRKYKMGRSTTDINTNENVELAYTLHPINGQDKEVQLAALEFAIEELAEEQKACIRLFYLEQKCYKVISEITGHDIKKVKSYIQNGKRNLKIHMQKLDE